jgi:hypothetical protein
MCEGSINGWRVADAATMITPSQPSRKPHSHELCFPFRRPIEFASMAGHTQKTPTSTMRTRAITFG